MRKSWKKKKEIFLGLFIVLLVLGVLLFSLLSGEKVPPLKKAGNPSPLQVDSPPSLGKVKRSESSEQEKIKPASPLVQEEKSTYQEIKKILCLGGLSHEEKNHLFETKYKGKRVTWEGEIEFVKRSSGKSLGVIFIRDKGSLEGGINLCLEEGANVPEDLKEGSKVTFTGILEKGLGPESHFFVFLSTGKVLATKEE